MHETKDMRLKKKGAIITGGASGIGAATARRFVKEGAFVVIADINDTLGHELMTELGAARCGYIHCDVADGEAVTEMIHQGNEWLTNADCGLDILFNNAGIGMLAKTPDLSPSEWHKVINVDLNSVFYGCRAAIPIMTERGGGAIVNTASISGLRGDYGFSAYSAAKAAVINYTRTLALDHGPDNIRVNALCPGVIDTPIIGYSIKHMQGFVKLNREGIPLKRYGKAEEMANVVLFLASEEASYVTGAAIAADGGKTAGTGQPDPMAWLASQAAQS
jgi:meso-butanediol dehydrogenase / (S,S)-butanediol dehydrogenase / diacetyl reductase